MLRQMDDMPAGTVGFEAVGDVEDDDWEDVVEPVLRREIAAGGKVRLLYLIGPEARDVDADAMQADTGFRARHAKAFERIAIVCDETGVKSAVRVLSMLTPGRMRAFPASELAAAKRWLAEPGEDST
jgi:hypothetical protein